MKNIYLTIVAFSVLFFSGCSTSSKDDEYDNYYQDTYQDISIWSSYIDDDGSVFVRVGASRPVSLRGSPLVVKIKYVNGVSEQFSIYPGYINDYVYISVFPSLYYEIKYIGIFNQNFNDDYNNYYYYIGNYDYMVFSSENG